MAHINRGRRRQSLHRAATDDEAHLYVSLQTKVDSKSLVTNSASVGATASDLSAWVTTAQGPLCDGRNMLGMVSAAGGVAGVSWWAAESAQEPTTAG